MKLKAQKYKASHFNLNENKIYFRNGKITPKKNGQFVTFWKRNGNKIIEPFHKDDIFDFLVINVNQKNKVGQFVFPKNIYLKKG